MVGTPNWHGRSYSMHWSRSSQLAASATDPCARWPPGVGTSHRMLLHHFGSREDLLVAIVEEVERRQMALLPDLPTNPADNFAAMWSDVRRPELRPIGTPVLRVLLPCGAGREAV